MIKENLIEIYKNSFSNNWNLKALSDYNSQTTYTYGDVAQQIERYHILFRELGINKGDKIALVGKNHSSWCIIFLATITYGGVIVPILHEFNPTNIEEIIEHSDSKVVFVEKRIWKAFNGRYNTIPVFELISGKQLNASEDSSDIIATINNKFVQSYPDGYTAKDISYPQVDNSEVVCINYTSGTTGFSKGVMLTANNIAGNVTYAKTLNLMSRGDEHLAFLPLAHVYGCAFDFLFALSIGVHVTLLGKMPTPQILLKALQDTKPTLVISVPLVFEKIYKKKILPMIETPKMKFLLKVPIFDKLIHKKIRQSLIDAMGGNVGEVIIGGAALNAEVEAFFHKIKFPFTVGYGMTECAPLIAYDHHYDFVPTSCGSILNGIMEARIDSKSPNEVGEIQVKGENVMSGYYKNQEATDEAFTADGWLRTGDLGILDGRRLYIKGRSKTMILSGSGQNIFPEEIESRINNLPYINESLVVKRKNKLVALVTLDQPTIKEQQLTEQQISDILQEHLALLNKSVAHYEKIAHFEIQEEEFEKTPKKSIKRFLYA